MSITPINNVFKTMTDELKENDDVTYTEKIKEVAKDILRFDDEQITNNVKTIVNASAHIMKEVKICDATKILKCCDVATEYTDELEKNDGSHVKSTIVTAVSQSIGTFMHAVSIDTSLTIGASVIAFGCYTIPAYVAGASVASLSMLVGSKLSNDTCERAKMIARKIINSDLPKIAKKYINKVISNSIEYTLTTIYQTRDDIVNTVKEVVTNILFDKWQSIKPDKEMSYTFNDNIQKTIVFDKRISKKIHDFCYECIHDGVTDFSNYHFDDSVKNNKTSNFEYHYRTFDTNIDNIINNKQKYNFDYIPNITMDKINIHNSSYGFLEPIDISRVPDYTITTTTRRTNGAFSFIGSLCFLVTFTVII